LGLAATGGRFLSAVPHHYFKKDKRRGYIVGSQRQYVRLIRIFVSSPGDVAEERKVIEEAIDQVNRVMGEANQVHLDAFKWDDNIVPQIGPEPQSVVDDQTPPYDIYIGIMSKRFGTPTRDYGSGTEQEFQKAIAEWSAHGSPWIMFYFDNRPASFESSEELDEYRKVVKFREELETKGIVRRYVGVRGQRGAFYEMVFEHLCGLARKLNPRQSYVTPRTQDTGESHTGILRDGTASDQSPAIDPLVVAQIIKEIHVDREKELSHFRDILAGRTDERIMIIQAESGLGKTGLINQFWAMSKGLQRAKVDFIIVNKRVGGTQTDKRVGGTLTDLCHQFDKTLFPVLHQQCANLMAAAQMAVSPAMLLSSIDAALAKTGDDDRPIHRAMITDAFFEDLSNIHCQDPNPIVMLFDTFQKAHESILEWLPEVFLPRIVRYPWIACVVCGQPTPALAVNLDCCRHIRLEGLKENYVREFFHRAKLKPTEQLVRYIAKHSAGRPSDLQQHALTLSKME
jgi:hypothetical protein